MKAIFRFVTAARSSATAPAYSAAGVLPQQRGSPKAANRRVAAAAVLRPMFVPVSLRPSPRGSAGLCRSPAAVLRLQMRYIARA